jgi:predicted alpha-1,6-mannanase (GH76 family)
VDTTSESQSGTTLTYPSADDDADAMAVAKALKLPTSAVKKSSSVSGITLTIGADWTTGTTYPKTSKSATKQLREAASALNADDKTACMKVNPVYSW